MWSAQRWWTLADTAVGVPNGGKLPSNGMAFRTADGSSRSRPAMRSPACDHQSQTSMPLVQMFIFDVEYNFILLICWKTMVHKARGWHQMRMNLGEATYHHGWTFRHPEVDGSRCWRQEWHTHLHDFNLCIWNICVDMATISDQEAHQLTRSLRNQSWRVMVTLQGRGAVKPIFKSEQNKTAMVKMPKIPRWAPTLHQLDTYLI